MERDIDINELKPCDILLFHGYSTISRLIQWFDGSEYSHSAVYDGSLVTEAVREGVRSVTVKVSMEHTEYVDVYRLKKNGEFIGSELLPSEPVLQVIEKYSREGERFSYEEVLLLAILCTTRRLPLSFLRWALDSAADILNEMIDGDKEPMVCSELVYRCFSEAGVLYRPRIKGADVKLKIAQNLVRPEPGKTPTKSAEASAAFLQLYSEAKNRHSSEQGVKLYFEPDSDFVTPKDLKKSPDFVKIGRLIRPA
jgi:hypothetical protein